MRNWRVIALMVLACALLASQAMGDVKLPALFGDNMVLQQQMPVPVWGWASPGEKVTVSIQGRTASATAAEDGRWMARLPWLKAGGPFEMTIAGNNRIALKNVLVGEVWICSGQSNMQMRVASCINAKEGIASAKYPQLRLFTVKPTVSDEPKTDVIGSWAECSPANVGDFSATAYFFGRELQKAIGVPIGLIHTSWGGTPAEAWTRIEVLQADSDFSPQIERWKKILADYPEAIKNYDEKLLPAWKEASEKAKAEGKPAPPAPWKPAGPEYPGRPAVLYNGMIAPLIPYAIQGAIWYQGEANAGRAYQYRRLFPAMIRNWRKDWGQGDFPFLFVQLANWDQPEPTKTAWAELREAQAMTLSLRHTGMATAVDIGDPGDIHPKNKQEVGRRLALVAEALVYGKDVVYSGPMYESMAVEGNAVRLRFSQIGGGLVARGGDSLKGFTIAGEDRQFVPAEAKLDGDTVIVRSDQVAKPVAVRYGWCINPECSLYNKAGLPAPPFRTDDWPGITEGKL